jgi:hypothetical protein
MLFNRSIENSLSYKYKFSAFVFVIEGKNLGKVCLNINRFMKDIIIFTLHIKIRYEIYQPFFVKSFFVRILSSNWLVVQQIYYIKKKNKKKLKKENIVGTINIRNATIIALALDPKKRFFLQG